MTLPKNLECLLVCQQENQVDATEFLRSKMPIEDLPAGDVLIRVHYSSLNFKDALAASGNRGVARNLPLIPGIDAVGEVVVSQQDRFQVGQNVLVAHAKFGTAVHGGFAEYARVPAGWVFPIPGPLTIRDAAALGTAGFTAAQSIEQLQRHGVEPSGGPILVTGATGGVGVIAVRMLANLGYDVVAVTGKTDRIEWLKQLGATTVLGRDAVSDTSPKPLLSAQWAGAIDTVGGSVLANVLKSIQPNGCVTTCGNVAGADLPTTVLPFILRGVTLCGIDSTSVKPDHRQSIWQRIADQAQSLNLDSLVNEISLREVPTAVEQMLAGKVVGRTIVRIDDGNQSVA